MSSINFIYYLKESQMKGVHDERVKVFKKAGNAVLLGVVPTSLSGL